MDSLCFNMPMALLLLCLISPFAFTHSEPNNPLTIKVGSGDALSMETMTRTDPVEQDAVYDIMRAMGNEWATNVSDVCHRRWHGIQCARDNENTYHVVSLSFGTMSDDTSFPSCNRMESHIPKSITMLSHVKTLVFYRCFMNNPQPIPSFLGGLGLRLQKLVLRENGHVGAIPDKLGNLVGLRVLDLRQNNLSGFIPRPLTQLPNLRSLDLSMNKLVGTIPNFASTSLELLNMGYNMLSGEVPSSIGSCKSMIKLDLSHNRLDGVLPKSIGDLKELILLDLSYNNLFGPLPPSIKKLQSLQVLNLEQNSKWHTPLRSNEFEGMGALTILVLSSMNLHGPIPKSLGQLSNLRVIHLDRNNINGSIPLTFMGLRNLVELRLNDNHLSGQVPFKREMLWKMRRNIKLHNNINLCYDNGVLEHNDSLTLDLGIVPCSKRE